MSIPLKDELLVQFSANFNTRINATPETFALTEAQATAYAALHDPFADSYSAMMAARAEGTRSQSQTATKDATKAALVAYARGLYAFVQASTSVRDADRILLGVYVRRARHSRIAAPTASPRMGVMSAVARTVRVGIYDSESSTSRGKPAGAVGAFVYSYVGEKAPLDPTHWQFQGAATKASYRVVFPDSVASGARVWLCAAWVNRRGEVGPVNTPIYTHVPGGAVLPTDLKIAA
ncbi:MAG: hypothetical protein WD042_00490 [Phycisphaeraceae bacterium]